MTIKILVVDDMPEWRNFHLSALNAVLKDNNQKFEITTKNSAFEAFEDVKLKLKEPYDLILSDLQMEQDYEPEHAGEWLIRNIKGFSEYKKRPVILISASYDIKFIASKINADYLPKSSAVNNPLSYAYKIKQALGL